MLKKSTSVRRTTYIHGTPKLYRRPGRAEARSKAGASWSGSAGKACNAQSAICAFRAGRGTGRELGAPIVRRRRQGTRKGYRWSSLGTSERITDLPYEVSDDTRLNAHGEVVEGRLPPAQVRTAQRRPTWLRSLPIHRLHAWSACSKRHLHRTRGINGLADGHLAVVEPASSS